MQVRVLPLAIGGEMSVIVERISWSPGDYMRLGETGEVLEYDFYYSRVYVKGNQFGTWVQLSTVKVISGDLNSMRKRPTDST